MNCRNSSVQCGHWRLLLSHTFACTLEIRKRLWTSKYVGRLGVGIRGHDDPINELCSPHWVDIFSGAAFIFSCFFPSYILKSKKENILWQLKLHEKWKCMHNWLKETWVIGVCATRPVVWKPEVSMRSLCLTAGSDLDVHNVFFLF